MVVQIQDQDQDQEGYEGPRGHAVLKVYDRQFATQFRCDERLPPWSVEIEEQFRLIILSGEIEQLFDRFDNGDYSKDDLRKNGVWCEAYLQYCLEEMFETEVDAYHHLSEYQGENIPEFYCSVKLLDRSDMELPSDHTIIQGILIQYLDGFSFTELPAHAPKELWQSIGEDAVQIVHCLNSKNILNTDVSSRNIIICKYEKSKFKPFMIDFALCRFREDAEDDTRWRKWKRFFKEGDLAFSIQKCLDGEFVYHRSEFYQMLDRELGTD